MNKSQAIQKIQHSLDTEEAIVHVPNGEDCEAHIEQLASKLLSQIIEPVRANVTSTCAKEGDFENFRKSDIWAIARYNDNWLLTLESENLFALGFGSEPSNIMMHGFASADVLGEWFT